MAKSTSAPAERSTVVVADSLAAQQWEMHLAAEQVGRAAAAWETPALEPYAAWLERLWREHGDGRAAPLDIGQAAALWRRVVAESAESAALIGHAGAAEWAADAWRALCHWQVEPLRQRARSDEPDYRAFLSWSRSYAERLRSHGWLDRAELEQALCACSTAGTSPIVTADLDEPYPARTTLLAQLAAQGTAVTATAAPAVAGTQRTVRLADSADELRAAFAWAARRLDAAPETRIAIVVADAARRRAAIERALEAAFGAHAVGRYASGGLALRGEPVIGAAFHALTLLSTATPYAAFGRWLRSPFFAAPEPETFARARLDRELRAELRSQLPFATAYRCGLRELFAERAPSSAQQLDRALATLGGLRRATPGRWAHLFARFLAALGWQAPLERRTLAGWQGALDELARLTPILGELSLESALAELDSLLERPAPPALPLAGVHVLQSLDEVGPGYAGAWVTGFTDAAWPEPTQGNPLLPVAVQRTCGLPYASPRDAEERSARKLERLVRRTAELVVSWPARVYDYETEPSPAIRAWPPLADAEIAAWQTARPATARARATIADPPPPLAGTRLPGGTGALKRQARCPILALCQDRLGARPLEALGLGLSARLRGIAVHRAAELLLADLPSQAELVAKAATIDTCVEHALDKVFRRTRAPLAELFALEAEQLGRTLHELLRHEATRAPFRVRAVEEDTDVTLGRLTLGVRADRIDELADGTLAVIDYKTGERATSADWFAPRLRDAQVPLYACEAGSRIGAAVIARVTPTGTSYFGLWRDDAFPGRPAKQAQDDIAAQQNIWRAQLDSLAAELAAGDARIFVAAAEEAAAAYAPLTRVFEQLGLARGAVKVW